MAKFLASPTPMSPDSDCCSSTRCPPSSRGNNPAPAWLEGIFSVLNNVGRAWSGMFDACCNPNADRRYVLVGNRMVPRGEPVSEEDWAMLRTSNSKVRFSNKIEVVELPSKKRWYLVGALYLSACFSSKELAMLNDRHISEGGAGREAWIRLKKEIADECAKGQIADKEKKVRQKKERSNVDRPWWAPFDNSRKCNMGTPLYPRSCLRGHLRARHPSSRQRLEIRSER